MEAASKAGRDGVQSRFRQRAALVIPIIAGDGEPPQHTDAGARSGAVGAARREERGTASARSAYGSDGSIDGARLARRGKSARREREGEGEGRAHLDDGGRGVGEAREQPPRGVRQLRRLQVRHGVGGRHVVVRQVERRVPEAAVTRTLRACTQASDAREESLRSCEQVAVLRPPSRGACGGRCCWRKGPRARPRARRARRLRGRGRAA